TGRRELPAQSTLPGAADAMERLEIHVGFGADGDRRVPQAGAQACREQGRGQRRPAGLLGERVQERDVRHASAGEVPNEERELVPDTRARTHEPYHRLPGPYSTRPGRAAVIAPCSKTTAPLTMTYEKPSAY